MMYPLSILSLTVVFASSAVAIANARNDDNGRVKDSYIVVLNDSADSDATAKDLGMKHGFAPDHTYSHVMKGFSAVLPPQALERVKRDPRVAFVSEDRIVTTQAQTLPTGVDRTDAEQNTVNKGTGIGVAVIDTGIDLTHPDLAGNIVANKSCVKGKKNGMDDNGHGTHVAGTIAALNNATGVVGVAPEAKLIAVKVLNAQGSGTWSSIICGIDWVTANKATYNIKVANMSLGGGGSSDNNCGNSNNDALHRAICRSRNAGITYVVAAGNSNANTNGFVPAAYDDAVITVSALGDSDGAPNGSGAFTGYGADDTFASFSNYGTAVDIAAPGVAILSTWKSGGYSSISGTSMASPHVAGAAALYLTSNPGATWTQVRDALKAAGEVLGAGHTDPSGLHPEPVLKANAL
jgi:subtilisin